MSIVMWLFKIGRAALAMVVRDEFSLLVEATSVFTDCLFVYEVEVKELERSVLHATDKG